MSHFITDSILNIMKYPLAIQSLLILYWVFPANNNYMRAIVAIVAYIIATVIINAFSDKMLYKFVTLSVIDKYKEKHPKILNMNKYKRYVLLAVTLTILMSAATLTWVYGRPENDKIDRVANETRASLKLVNALPSPLLKQVTIIYDAFDIMNPTADRDYEETDALSKDVGLLEKEFNEAKAQMRICIILWVLYSFISYPVRVRNRLHDYLRVYRNANNNV